MISWLIVVPGCGRGVMRLIGPSARLLSGALFSIAVLKVHPDGEPGSLLLILGIPAYLIATGLPPIFAVRTVFVTALLYLPLAWLANTTIPALSFMGGLEFSRAMLYLIRGACGILVVNATISVLPPVEFEEGIAGLPLPYPLRLIMRQILHQFLIMQREAQTVQDALVLRTARSGRLIFEAVVAFPAAWLTQMLQKAHRLADAMEIRVGDADLLHGYGIRRWRKVDKIAVSFFAAILIASIAFSW